MRRAFVTTLIELAERDERIVLLTGDLGFGVIEPFIERFPRRFFNIGVAEQNMIGIATGLAEAGLIPFAYSIATFATLRPFEFIRNGPALHRLPVRIVGVGGGVEYGANGPTHHALEDVALMRTLSGMTVITPADWLQAQRSLHSTAELPGPIYYRLGRNDTDLVPGLEGAFEIGRLQTIGDGDDIAIVVMGAIAAEATRAVELLAHHGVAATVVVVASVSPPPNDDLAALFERHDLILTIENHAVIGGLGSLVAEAACQSPTRCRIVRIGIDDTRPGITGSERFLLELHGLSAERITERALAELINAEVTLEAAQRGANV